ncbi:probable GTPase Era at C-terminar half [Coccomyxa sp. Obi]|nr:probable GTPase Era at C-terminar half [Coccomyxa sp. Obi]
MWRLTNTSAPGRSVSLLRLLVQARAASQHTNVLAHSQDDDNVAAEGSSGTHTSRPEVSSLLDGLRRRLSALEGAQAAASSTFQQQHTSVDGADAAVHPAEEVEESLDAPAVHQMLWAQRAPQLFPGIATGPEEMEPAEEEDHEEFDVSQLGKSPEVDRLLSILSTPVRLPSPLGEDTMGSSEPASRMQPSSHSSATSMGDRSNVSTQPLGSSLTEADSTGADAAGRLNFKHQQEVSFRPAFIDRERTSDGVFASQSTHADAQFKAAASAGAEECRADEEDPLETSGAGVEYSRAAQQPFSALQDADIPDAAADFDWKQARPQAQPASREDLEPLDSDEETFLAGGYGMAEGPGSEAVPVSDQKLLQAGIVGVPNSGKSTLTNALVGHKVSAVSSKTNTTDAARLGAFTEGTSQVALYDTPGVVSTRFFRGNQHAKRVRSAWGTAADCELLLFIVDAHRQITEPDERVVKLVEELAAGPLPSWEPPPAVLLLNKIDRLTKEQRPLLDLLREHLCSIYPFKDTFRISAKHRTGVAELREYLLSRSIPGKWTLLAGENTDMTANDLAREVLKEKMFRRLYKELPYEVQIEDVSFKTLTDGSLRIEKNLMVRSDQVRRIVVGKQGAAIGEIGASARKDLEAMLQKRVHLMLNVKVTKKNSS